MIITKNGRAVAKVAPQPADRRDDPEWRAAHERLLADLRGWRGDGYRVGKITEEDKYGPLPDYTAALNSNVLYMASSSLIAKRAVRKWADRSRLGHGILAVQAIGEFLWVVRRRRPEWLERADGAASAFVGC